MKKILLIIMCLIFITGCQSNKQVEKKDYTKEYESMKNQLIEYGKLIYDMYITNQEIIEPGTYHMSLKEMNEHIGHDVSMFVNPETKEVCNQEKTMIEFIVSEPFESGKNNYRFNPIIVCE